MRKKETNSKNMKTVPTSLKEKKTIKEARKKLAELAKTAVIGDIISPINVKWEANS